MQYFCFVKTFEYQTIWVLLYFRSNDFAADFKLPTGSHILIIPEIDYVSGQKEYKKNIAKFFKFAKVQSSYVICVRSEVTANDFTGVQTFCVVEVGKTIFRETVLGFLLLRSQFYDISGKMHL